MPSAADFERHARQASGRASELRQLAQSIRSISAPLTIAFDPLSARHLVGIWISSAAQRSRNELFSLRQECRSAGETSKRMAVALERSADGFDDEARRAGRHAAAAREEAARDKAKEDAREDASEDEPAL